MLSAQLSRLDCGLGCDTANGYDGAAFQHLVDDVADEMVVFADMSFEKKDWQPTNLRLCKRGEWNVRMVVETVLSVLTYICHFKHSHHQVWTCFETKLGFTIASVAAQYFVSSVPCNYAFRTLQFPSYKPLRLSYPTAFRAAQILQVGAIIGVTQPVPRMKRRPPVASSAVLASA